jgi:two-component system, NarL family, nitrate/nitrite response regulator NarL
VGELGSAGTPDRRGLGLRSGAVHRESRDVRSLVLVVAGQSLLAEALVIALRSRGRWNVEVAVPTDVESSDSLRAAVVIVGLDLEPSGSASSLISSVVGRGGMALAMWNGCDRYVLAEALEAGATGTLDTRGSLDGAAERIRDTADGVSTFPVSARADLVADLARHRAAERSRMDRFARLTPRESQVLGLLMAGRSTEEMAAMRIVSVATVRTQIRNILTKLEVKSQLAAVALAARAGWDPYGGPELVLSSQPSA